MLPAAARETQKMRVQQQRGGGAAVGVGGITVDKGRIEDKGRAMRRVRAWMTGVRERYGEGNFSQGRYCCTCRVSSTVRSASSVRPIVFSSPPYCYTTA